MVRAQISGAEWKQFRFSTEQEKGELLTQHQQEAVLMISREILSTRKLNESQTVLAHRQYSMCDKKLNTCVVASFFSF